MLLWVVRIAMVTCALLMWKIFWDMEKKKKIPVVAVILFIVIGVIWFASMDKITTIVEHPHLYSEEFTYKMIGDAKGNSIFEMILR